MYSRPHVCVDSPLQTRRSRETRRGSRIKSLFKLLCSTSKICMYTNDVVWLHTYLQYVCSRVCAPNIIFNRCVLLLLFEVFFCGLSFFFFFYVSHDIVGQLRAFSDVSLTWVIRISRRKTRYTETIIIVHHLHFHVNTVTSAVINGLKSTTGRYV